MDILRKISFLLIFIILICGSVSALEIAVIHENKAVSGILVEIEEDYEIHQYITDVNGKFFANLTEGYYWVTIDVVETADLGEKRYTYANEMYLVDDELNIIECEINETPGFGIIVFICAIAFSILIIRKRRRR